MADLLYIRTKQIVGGKGSCFYVSDVGWLVVEMGVEMGVLHSIVEEGEGAWLGICFGEASHMSPKKILLFSLKDILIKD